jgi:hypothetical protein
VTDEERQEGIVEAQAAILSALERAGHSHEQAIEISREAMQMIRDVWDNEEAIIREQTRIIRKLEARLEDQLARGQAQ